MNIHSQRSDFDICDSPYEQDTTRILCIPEWAALCFGPAHQASVEDLEHL